jgi:glycosyltransferase involved in cell wall biosynthesis
MNSNVKICPNRVPRWLLEHQRPKREAVTIGWAGSASHAMDWDDAAPQVGRFLARNPHVQAHVIGKPYPSMRIWPAKQLRNTGWLDSVDDYYRAIDLDIALAPLKPHVFNQAKSSVRCLEMAALGIPVVASAAGPYEAFVQHGVTGLLVRRDHEWGQHLRTLTSDEAMRAELGRNARQLAAEHTVEGNLGAWLDAWQVPANSTV